ncbi:MAG: PQQ-binding-like beta-propeller repeat protein [Planctomycetota bacterium]
MLTLLVWLSTLSTIDDSANWPAWRGAQRDGIAHEVTVPEEWPKALSRIWTIDVAGGLSSPIARDGRVYLLTRSGEREIVSCRAWKDGGALWSSEYASPFVPNPHMDPPGQFPVTRGHGPFATPALAESSLLTLGSARVITAWSLDGEKRWQKSFYAQPAADLKALVCLPCGRPCDEKVFTEPGACPECDMALAPKGLDTTGRYYGASSSPLVTGDHVIFHVGTAEVGQLVALDVESGDVAWSLEEPPGYTSPIIATLGGTPQIVVLSRDAAIGVDASSGKELWRYPLGNRAKVMTPVVVGDRIIVSGYQRPTEAIEILASDEGWTAEPAWKSDLTLYMSSPVRIDGVLYGFSSKRQGQLFALDIESGETLWTSDGRLGENATLVGLGSCLSALTTEGRLIIYRAIPTAFEILADYNVSETPTWTTPVFWKNEILIKEAGALTLWRVK